MLVIFLTLLTSPADAREKLRIAPASIVIAVGASEALQIKGQYDQNFSVGAFDPNLLKLSVDKRTRYVFITAKDAGETIIAVVNDRGEFAACRVVAKKLAGYLPHAISAWVTGHPTLPETLIEAAVEAVTSAVTVEDSGAVSLDKKKVRTYSAFGSDEGVVVEVPVTVTAPHCFPVKGKVYAYLYRTPLPDKDEDYLMVSNNPEVIPRAGILFDGRITKGEAVRLLYYHQARAGGRFWLSPTLINESSETATLVIIGSASGPDPDGIYLGHVATVNYLKAYRASSGRIINLPPGRSYRLAEHLVSNGSIATGIFTAHLLKGSDIKIEVRATDHTPDENLSVLDPVPTGRQVSGTFKKPFVDIERTYHLQDNYLSVNIGEDANFRSLEMGENLKGNYGILYRLNYKFINSTDDIVEPVSIFYATLGGPARGVFVVGNKILETGFLGADKKLEEKFFTFNLLPRSERTLTLWTMPQPGSFYPTQVVVWGSSHDMPADITAR